eukprot:CAMPEP_0183363668 /NCGR_PEP_ID=MMETSP0164_2-20130417/76300_1 /TAXON_ID=221442 /ORGANISM="Coccolithus pelagicus ssp braarudi, Strain PLY182g" /LENGTH=43 /DNA_ID= /DNA_START= /DNA_END= /DNA_ORIENTATION=
MTGARVEQLRSLLIKGLPRALEDVAHCANLYQLGERAHVRQHA